MRCTVCGTQLNPVLTDLPFKLSDDRNVILKRLPVLQCGSCPEYLIEDAVMARIDEVLTRADSTAELEMIRYAA